MSGKDQPSDAAVGAWAELLRTARRLTEAVEDRLKAADLPPLAWYDALHEVARARPDGLRPYELIGRMLLAQYNVSRLLARLEAEGLVERRQSVDDGRGQVVHITDTGLDLRRRMWAVYGPAIATLAGERLPEAELEALRQLLSRLR
jgi:DNA-binding MarR family transcriptional regulator